MILRKSLPLAAAFGLAFVATPSLAVLREVTATVQVQIATLPPPTITGMGAGDSVGGGIATIPAMLLINTAPVDIAINPTFVGLARVTAPANSISNPAGSFNPNGAMGLNGDTFFLTAMNGPAGQVPLSPIGGANDAMANIAGINLTVLHATWMGAPTATPQVFSFMGAAAANAVSAMATAYDNRTANGEGTVQLVAPATADLGALGDLPVFGVLTLTFAPEPGYLLLLGIGAATLAVVGRRKARN